MIFDRKVFVLGGPTGSGKSSLALHFATHHQSILINGDSLQLYKELPILTAHPTLEDMRRTPHSLYSVLTAEDTSTAGLWARLAAVEIKKAWEEDTLPVVVGGTGFYLKSLLDGLSPIPDVSKEVRETGRDLLRKKGLLAFFKEVQEIDPILAKRISPNDTQRLLRAWEVFHATKKPLSTWQKIPPVSLLPEASFIKIFIQLNKEDLKERIAQRAKWMLSHGAVEEVKKLQTQNIPENHPLKKALGIRAIECLIRGDVSFETCFDEMVKQTVQYAKRQLTWFRHQFKDAIMLDGTINIEKVLYLK